MESRDFLKFIKKRRTIRLYKNKSVSNTKIYKILEASRWAPSIHNIQPWRFIVVEKRFLINRIVKILFRKAQDLFAGVNIIVRETAKILAKAPVVIIVYNSCELSKRMTKLEEPYFSITQTSEIESVSAAIENMLLMAQTMGLGVAWLTAPLFCEKEIKSLVNIKDGNLLALLTVGYPVASLKNRLVKRKPLNKIIRFG